jgi:hypothetical protein
LQCQRSGVSAPERCQARAIELARGGSVGLVVLGYRRLRAPLPHCVVHPGEIASRPPPRSPLPTDPQPVRPRARLRPRDETTASCTPPSPPCEHLRAPVPVPPPPPLLSPAVHCACSHYTCSCSTSALEHRLRYLLLIY